MLDAMIELFRLPEVQRLLAVLAAVASGCYSFHLAMQSTMHNAIKRAPQDGQAALGAEFMGCMAFVLVALATYLLVSHSMRTWEKQYARKLEARHRLEDQRSIRS
jgi:hypothetical protein